MMREKERKVPSGYLMLVVNLVLQLAAFYWLFIAIAAQSVPSVISAVIVSLLVAILWGGGAPEPGAGLTALWRLCRYSIPGHFIPDAKVIER